jgi:hypothetical protein
MRPFWFKDLAELQCLAGEIASEEWKLNLNFWTAATQQSCWGQWSWCSRESSPLQLAQNLVWAERQPDNADGDEGCLHLRLFKNGSTPALSDRNCTFKYFLACKVCVTFLFQAITICGGFRAKLNSALIVIEQLVRTTAPKM